MNDLKTYVDSLFANYEETKELADFKEELTGFLNDKINALVKKGRSETDAFREAAAELGGIATLADEISLKRKQEAIGEAYMGIRGFLKPPRIIAYIASGLTLAFAALAATIAFFAVSSDPAFAHPESSEDLTALFGVLFAFVPLALAAFSWLILTQETPFNYAMTKKRALWYAAGFLVLSGGLLLVPLTYFSTGGIYNVIGAISVLIPCALPSLGLLVYLFFTEKDRRKPWARRAGISGIGSNPVLAARFGLFSGAIWTAAAALFFLIGFIAGFRFAWVVLLFALAGQLWVRAVMTRRDGGISCC